MLGIILGVFVKSIEKTDWLGALSWKVKFYCLKKFLLMLHLHFKSYLEMSWLICWLRKQWFLSLLSIEMKLHFETWTCTAMSLIHFRRISTTSEIRESTEGESRTCVWRSTLFSPMDNILRKSTSSGGPWKQQDWRNDLIFRSAVSRHSEGEIQ